MSSERFESLVSSTNLTETVMRARLLLLILNGLAATACGQTAAPALPAAVGAALDAFRHDCIDVGGTPDTEDDVRRADLNGDGRDDFVLYTGWITCKNAYSIYGDREKALSVFVGGDNDGAALAFEDAVFDAKIERPDARPAQLWLTTWAEGCGVPPAATFAAEHFCDRAIVWNAATRRFDYAPLDTIRKIE